MLKALEDISGTKKRLKIEIPAEALESEIQKGLVDVQRRTRLPGFRPGKAPMSMIEKKFGKNVEAEVLEKVIPEFYLKALQESDLKPVSQPVVEESFDFKRNAPLSLTVMVEVRPKVETLTYEGLSVKDIPVEVKEEDIETVLKNLAEERAAYDSVDDAIQSGDLVTLDYTVREDGTSAKDVVLKVGSGPFPQEFVDALVGKKKEEECVIEASFPEDSSSPFAGKRPTFEIKLKEIKRRTVAAIDDEFAKDLGHDTLGDLREKLRERILASKGRAADREKQKELVGKLVETHVFEVPESLLDMELSGIVNEVRASNKDERPEEAIREEYKPAIEKSLRASLLLEMIGEKEGVTVSEEDMKEEIRMVAEHTNLSPENVMKYYITRDGSLERLGRTLLERKVLNVLLSKATVEGETER